ncbi:hypothetical protein PVAND_007125 [Polypedilum vanderplanki]|uniref:3'-5' exonuclease domain-containing protein n=1 Tax=Polypedilum vanderplanki TaxID=319348 RepID=A0A9J6C5G2_POLVA|nr:hypothetical protein PVAND_007125 [Polypedilum vanderplanki]
MTASIESMEYEQARNLTLLFFFERLIDKNEPRTLHDLSCQFGAPGFTKEMRQIAGGSQSGLKKFLLQYPALFMVDGEYVHINSYQHRDDGNISGKKDYIQEAKDYFSHKLLQYGAGTEVPIKSLLGHRSQASPQVRHISGQHIKEFTDFLTKHPDTFRIVDDHVVLVNYDSATVIPAAEKLHLPQPSIDVKNTQQILDFFAQCIEVKGPILVEQLFHLVTSNFPQEHWYKIFKTPNDLTAFLKLFSDCFHIQSNLVTLLQKPKISENHIQHAQKILYKNNLNITSPVVIGDFKLNEPISNTMSMSSNNNNVLHSNMNRSNSNNKICKSGSPSLNYNNDDSLNNGRNNSTNDLPSLGLPQSLLEIKLENLCTRNCPPKLSTYSSNNTQLHIFQQNNNNAQESVSSLPSTKAERNERDRRINLTLKQRISNLVTKTLAENEEKDKKISNNTLQSLNNGNNSSSNSSSNSSPVHTRNYFMGDTWKIKVLQNTRVITSIKESLFVCEAIKKSAPPNECVIISFDCEGVNLGTKGQLTIVEIGTVRGEAFIFDLQVCPQLITDGGLRNILEDENIIKIIHDCRNDAYNLYTQYNVLIKNVFDTQSAHAVLQYQDTGKQVYKVKNVSLNTLCEMYNAPINPMKDQLKNIYKRDPKYWSRRPLSRDMLLYAASDVLVLINEQLFRTMSSSIKPENMCLFSELCTEQIYMLIRPNDVKLKKKQRKISTEVFDLKQKLQMSNKNVVLSNREIRLLRYLDLTEEEKEKLKGSVKVAKKLEKLENIGQDRNFSDSDDDGDNNEQEYASLDSVPSDNSLPSLNTFSPKNSEPPSFMESMHLMNELISDKSMDKAIKIDKLEALLSVAATLPDQIGIESGLLDEGIEMKESSVGSNRSSATDITKQNVSSSNQIYNDMSPTPSSYSSVSMYQAGGRKDAACQTLSTGDIVITKIFFKEDKDNTDKTLISSPIRDKF